jgi:EAL domain-containing protein (putative c-di-GMP-specific phosphodiesterase class I)
LQRRFPASPPLTVNVNLSSKEFIPILIDQIQLLLGENGIDGSMLRLEITESTIMRNPESTAALLHELKALGVGLQIDDFGTGYSSLSYLHTLPISALKIDQSFVRRMNDNKENFEIVKTIIALAHNLGMDVIGEGVETAEELALLQELGCDYAQGYFIAKPMEFDAIESLLTAASPYDTVCGIDG